MSLVVRRPLCPAAAATAAIAAAIAIAGLAGCGPKPPPPGVSYKFKTPVVLLPEPGATNLLTTGDRGYRLRCQGKAPSLTLDSAEVDPPRVRAGQPLNHRLVYTYCANPGGEAIAGALTTTVRQGGQTMAEDSIADFRLAPGQWALDARIVIPADASPGAYQIDSRFTGAASFARSVAFQVE